MKWAVRERGVDRVMIIEQVGSIKEKEKKKKTTKHFLLRSRSCAILTCLQDASILETMLKSCSSPSDWGRLSGRRVKSLGCSLPTERKGHSENTAVWSNSSIYCFFALLDMPSCTQASFLWTAVQGGSFWRIPEDHYGPHYYYIKSIKEHTCTTHWFDLELTKASVMCNYKKLNDPFILNATSVAPNMLWWIAHYVQCWKSF